MKKVKKHRNYDDLVSSWVNDMSVDHSISGNSSRMYTEGGKIFSYGSHFCIANVLHSVTLFNSGNYSNSRVTPKHKSLVRYHLRGEVIEVPNPEIYSGEEHLQNLEWLVKQKRHALDMASRARKRKQSWLDQAEKYSANIDRYMELFPQAIAHRLKGGRR